MHSGPFTLTLTPRGNLESLVDINKHTFRLECPEKTVFVHLHFYPLSFFTLISLFVCLFAGLCKNKVMQKRKHSMNFGARVQHGPTRSPLNSGIDLNHRAEFISLILHFAALQKERHVGMLSVL